jgi:sulfate/thiosulfate transport system ATP-binding protein
LEVADRVVLMNESRVEQVGTPADVYHHPASAFVYNFLGNVNLFRGRVEEGQVYLGDIPIGRANRSAEDGTNATVFIRPHLLDIAHQPGREHHFRGTVKHINAAGPLVRVDLVSEWGDSVHVELSHDRYNSLELIADAEVYLIPKERKVFVEAAAGA